MKKITSYILLVLCMGSVSLLSAQNWNIVWQDEFNGGIGPDWVFETGNGSGGWGNNEFQYYRRENATVENGQLVITARQENFNGFDYTSARMKTQGRKTFKFGKIEARIALPSGQGLWPAFWLLGSDITSVGWPSCGEIDIMERINTSPTVFGTIHWSDQNGNYATFGSDTPTDAENFHVYSIEWDTSAIKWFVDGRQYHEADISNGTNGTGEFQNGFFILLNMAVGGNFPGFNVDNSRMPARMLVDYVRVSERGGTNPPPPTGDVETWTSANINGNTIRHQQGRARIDANVSPADDGRWRMVPGLAGQGISFQSVNFPNSYLRHRDSQVWLDPFQDNATFRGDASFNIRGGLSDAGLTSFESVNFPGRYLRHRGSLLYVEGINSDLARRDATFSSNGNGGSNPGTSQQIEAENFSAMNGVQTEPCSEGGENVGYLDNGDWMAYANINFPSSGSYRIEYRVASAAGGGRLSPDLDAGAVQLGELGIPNTGGWQNWTTISQNVNVNAGSRQFGIYVVNGGFNINWIRITPSGNAAASALVASSELIADPEGSIGMKMFPNPAVNSLQFSYEGDEAKVAVFDLSGREVMSQKSIASEEAIDVSDLKKGLYVVVIDKDGTKETKRLIKD